MAYRKQQQQQKAPLTGQMQDLSLDSSKRAVEGELRRQPPNLRHVEPHVSTVPVLSEGAQAELPHRPAKSVLSTQPGGQFGRAQLAQPQLQRAYGPAATGISTAFEAQAASGVSLPCSTTLHIRHSLPVCAHGLCAL